MTLLTRWLYDFATRREREYDALLAELARAGQAGEAAAAPDAPPDAPADTEAAEQNGWLMSSIELRCGLRISELPVDTLPGELRDALIPPRD